MIVAGIGSRKGVSGAEVLAALDAALAAHGLGRNAVAALATTSFKRHEAGIFSAAQTLGLEVVIVDESGEHSPSMTGATLAPPSPLWGGIEGGGAETLMVQPQATVLAQLMTVPAPPPLTPPHKGEGAVVAATPIRHPAKRGGGAERSEAEGGLLETVQATRMPGVPSLSQLHAGTPSVSETAALLAAGPGARLLGLRIATGRVTCALARSGAAS